MKPKNLLQLLFVVFVAALLSACDSHTKFVAPEIDPPTDLIPGYIPEGFELIKGYQIRVGDFEARYFSPDPDDCDEETRIICGLDLAGSFLDLQSPAGNDILGLHYQDGDSLLLITKSYYPSGSLDQWQAAYEANGEGAEDCKCDYACFAFMIDLPPLPIHDGEIKEMRTVGETQVAVLNGPIGTLTVFVQGDYLLAVESNIALEEILKVVESLLEI